MRSFVRAFATVCLSALGACAVSVPATYLGIATGAPPSEDEAARLAEAKAAGRLGTGNCSLVLDGAASAVPCEDLPMARLAELAWSDHRHAMLELGKRLEAGRGAAQDLDAAQELYRKASLTTGGTAYVYVPAVGDTPGSVMPLFDPPEPGLAEAAMRFALLRSWREKQAEPARRECPAPRTGLDTLAAREVGAEERARLDRAIAQGKLGRGMCLWQKSEKVLTTIPCNVVPLPMLAQMTSNRDRRAAMELASRFEEGRGGAQRDIAQAEALYCAAARTRITEGGPGAAGWTLLQGEPGLAEAEERYSKLLGARESAGI